MLERPALKSHKRITQQPMFQWAVFGDGAGGTIKVVVHGRAESLAEVDPSLFGAPLVDYGAETTLAAANAAVTKAEEEWVRVGAAKGDSKGPSSCGGRVIGVQLKGGMSLREVLGGTICTMAVSSRGGGTAVGISSVFGSPSSKAHK
jgi:DNA-binding protein YbaB